MYFSIIFTNIFGIFSTNFGWIFLRFFKIWNLYKKDPDPWFFSVCVQHNVLLANEKNFHMRFFNIVTSQSCAAQKFGTIGHSYLGLQSWDFRFFMNFFSPSPKKKIFFFILIENKFVLIFSSFGKYFFFVSSGKFFR